eukprot:7991019-Lingulodinium_polyedra.AAC.1
MTTAPARMPALIPRRRAVLDASVKTAGTAPLLRKSTTASRHSLGHQTSGADASTPSAMVCRILSTSGPPRP